MNIENIRYSNTIIWFLLCLIALITIYPFFEIGLATGDDILYYHLVSDHNMWSLAFDFAKTTGRFYRMFVDPFYTTAYAFDNFIYTKTVQYSSLLLSFLLFGLVVRKAFKSNEAGFLSLVILLTTLSLSKWTSVIICYPFYFTFSFTLLLCSVLLLFSYLEKGNKKTLIVSAIIYFLGLLFYEVYLIFLLIVAIIIYSHYKTKPVNQERFAYNQFFKTLFPFIIVGGTYLIIYLSFYFAYPTEYEGNAVASEINLESVFSILTNYPKSAYPLNVFDQNQPIFRYQSDIITGHKNNFWYILSHSNPESILKAILSCLVVFLIIRQLPKINGRSFWAVLIVALILVYLSNSLLTITKKYSVYYPELKGYIPTFFSFFGVVLFFIVIFCFLNSFTERLKIFRTILHITFLSLLFICSIQTSYSNYYTAKDMAQSRLTFELLDDFNEWKGSDSISENSVVYAEDLWKTSSVQIEIFNQGYSWTDYFRKKKGKAIHTAKNKKMFSDLRNQFPKSSVYIIKKQEAHKTKEAIMLFAAIKPDTLIPLNSMVDSLTVFYYSTYKEFSLSFRLKGEQFTQKTITIGTHKDTINANHYSCNISYNNKNSSSSIVKIVAPNIDINSITISNIRKEDLPSIEVYE